MIEDRRRYLAACLAVSLPALPAFAQTAPAPVTGRELVVQNPPATLTDDFATLIGTVGLKTPVKVTAPVMLRDLLREQCGLVQPAYIKAIQAANGDTSLDFSTSLAAGRELMLPPCPPSLQIGAVPTKVRSGDNFVSYWKASAPSLPLGDVLTPASGDAGLSIVAPAETTPVGRTSTVGGPADVLPIGLQATASSSITFANLARALNGERLRSLNAIVSNDTVLVPTVLTSTYSLPLDDRIANDPDAETRARDTVSAAAGGSDAEVRQELRFYGAVAPRDCKSGYANFGEDYENYLFRLLAENRAVVGEDSFTPALVMVLDSGLYDQAGLPGRPQINMPVSQPVPGSTGSGAKPYWPFDFIGERMHGTEVASLTVGGAPMADLLSAVDIRQKILPVNIFASISGLAAYEGRPFIVNGTVPEVTIERIARDVIMTHLYTVTAQVVNMSFGGPGDTTLIPSARVGAASETLYVAAAGNDDVALDDTDFYPARSGGRASPNILTVASVDSDGQLSWFSNSSARFVDIAAPGCRVPVLSYEADPQGMVPAEGTGTSFSAPQVSWVASMISGAVGSGDRRASSVKKRILASADIVPALADKVTDGRVLNPKKALSLTRDVVEVKSEGGSRLRRGLLADDARSPSAYCDPAPVRSHSQLLKVVPGFDGRSNVADRNWLYFGDQDGTVEAVSCKARPFELRFRDAAVSDDAMTSADVADIVFRW